ncbi:response regulator transcription factor [Caulobacter sp. ErkDOM-E]|uniref:helix-turn-helix transcriptional regulator n=1 Tax=Caulobacter sp. ErkDOM-E TaxID=3402778 RepID=UPI003AF9CC1F
MHVKIVSNQVLCLQALEAQISEGLKASLVETVSDVSALLQTPSSDPDLLLLDLPASAEPAAWIASTAVLKAKYRILVVPEKNTILARLAYRAGFAGLIPKTSSPGLVLAALKVVLEGGEYFPCFGDVDDDDLGSRGAAARTTLTPRQIEVLQALGQGLTNKEISRKLGMSLASVKLDVRAILSAAGAKNRTEAMRKLRGSEAGLLQA